MEDFVADLQVITADTVQRRVLDQLRDFLMLGRFKPGRALKIAELREAFGTSAQPVRESIRQLVAERALEALPNRSARVPLMTRARLEDLRRVRLALEGLAAELATERVTAADIAALQALNRQAAAADNSGASETSVRLNKQFHFTLYALAGSAALIPLIESLWLQIGPVMRLSADHFDASNGRGALMHVRMVEGLQQGDKAMVKAALTDDINRSFTLVAAQLD